MSVIHGVGPGGTNGLGKVAKGLSKVADFLESPLKVLTEPLKQQTGSVLEKLPFGMGNLIKPYASNFLTNPQALTAGGPLGGLAMMASSGTMRNLTDMAGTLGSVVSAGADTLAPQALGNVQNLLAHSQAGLLARQLA